MAMKTQTVIGQVKCDFYCFCEVMNSDCLVFVSLGRLFTKLLLHMLLMSCLTGVGNCSH